MLTFQRERIQDMLEEFSEMVNYNFKTVSSNQQELPLDVDWKLYKQLEDMGMVHVTTIRDANKLIGYMSFITGPAHNFTGLTFAYGDKYVVLKEYWGQGLGKKLVQCTLDWAKELGCRKIGGAVKLDQGPAPLKMYTDLGFEAVETVVEKLIDV